MSACCFCQFMRQYIQKNFRIRIGIYMAKILQKHFMLELFSIREITVMS